MEKKIWISSIIIILFFAVFDFSRAATLSVSPASGTFEVGDKITLKVLVSSNIPINAISGIISFPSSIFSIESVSKIGSVLDFWVTEPNINKGASTLSFEGVALGGFQSGNGNVVFVTMKALKPGSGEVSFLSGQVLANDGQGTDVTSGLSGTTFSVIEKKETPVIKKVIEPEVVEIPDVPQKPPSLASPEISLTKKFGEQAISGTSDYPRTQLLLTFVAETGIKVFITGETDINGDFILLVPQTLKRGNYKVSATVVKEDITHSFVSNEIIVKVGNLFSDIGIEIKISIIFLVLLLVYLIIRTYFYLRKNKKLRFFVKKETEDALDTVHKSFKILKNEVGEVNTKELKKELSEAEDMITKEIKDIEGK